MKFENHLFISYAHLDNVPVGDDTRGWVGLFHSTLTSFLSSTLALKPMIWRDNKLKGNDEFSAEIVAQFPQTATMISVVSQRYVESTWCIREVTEFCKAAAVTDGLGVERKMRVYQVFIWPLAEKLRGQLPKEIEGALGYEFFKKERDDEDDFEPLDPRFGDESKAAFNREIFRLAKDVAKVVKKLLDDPNPVSSGPPKETVFLSECSRDRREDREKIRAELQANGYTVLPEAGTRLPDDEVEYIAEVRRLLGQSQLSIHIVGENAAKVPDGPGRKDAVELQNEIAAKQSEERGLPRVIWLPVATSTQPEQQAFIDALRSSAELQRGGDLIESTFEGLKNAIRVALTKLKEPPPRKAETAATGPRLVYVICIANDCPATVPLRKFLRDSGLDVQVPVFEGDAATVRQANQELLARCDAAIIYYGAGDEAWQRAMKSDLQKSKGARGEKPLLASLTYLAGPSTAAKTDCIAMGEKNMLNALEAFPQSELAAFIQSLNGAGK